MPYARERRHVRLFKGPAEIVAMHVNRTGDTEAETGQRRRKTSVTLCVPCLVVRVQLGRVGCVPGQRRVDRSGGHARVHDRPVGAHTEHVLGHRHLAPGDAHVFGVHAGSRVLREPAPYAAGHRAAPEPHGRRAPGIRRPDGGQVHAGASHVPYRPVRR